MSLITFLIFLIWLACGVLVVRFVIHTGGTKNGKVAHWFGGAFTMLGLAIIIIFIYLNLSSAFAEQVDNFLLNHFIGHH